MNVTAYRSSSATVRPTVLLGLAVFMFALTLQEIAAGTRSWLWSGTSPLFLLVLGSFGARYAGH